MQRKNRNKLENTLIIVGDVDSIYKLLENIGENFSSYHLLSSKQSQLGRLILGKKIQPISELSKIISNNPQGLMIIGQSEMKM